MKVASHSFQFRNRSGLVQVVKGYEYPDDHPAVRHRPDWFTTDTEPADEAGFDVGPETGEDTPDDGEE